MTDVLEGQVVSYSPPYYKVECPRAHQSYLVTHHLVQSEIGAAKVGDKVELSYVSYPSRAYWYVSKVLPCSSTE